MRKVMFLLVGATALAVSASSTGSVSAAAAVDGTVIAKAASAIHDAHPVRWRWRYFRPGVRRGVCLNSPAHC
jgi:hypothetical protein